jgi:steroid delta-isomerase-like uncharacterized protein
MRPAAVTTILVSLAAACGGAGGEASKPIEAPPPPSTATASASSETTPPPPGGASSAKPSMQELQKTLIGSVAEAINAHDAAKFAANYADDASLAVAGFPDPIKGKDGVQADAKKSFDAFPNTKIAFARVWGKNDLLVSEWFVTGTHSGEFMGVKPTDKPVGYVGLSVTWVNADGKIKEEHRYFDAATLFAQLGAAPKNVKARAVPALPASIEWHWSKADASEDKDVDGAKALYAATEKKDEKSFTELVTDDIVWDDAMAPAATRGKAEMVKGFKQFTTAFPDLKMATSNAWGIEDFAIAEYTLNATNKAPFMGLPVAKKPVALHGADVIQLRDGKIVKGWSYGNGAELLVQVGAMKPPGAAPPPKDPKAPAKAGAKPDAKPPAPPKKP